MKNSSLFRAIEIVVFSAASICFGLFIFATPANWAAAAWAFLCALTVVLLRETRIQLDACKAALERVVGKEKDAVPKQSRDESEDTDGFFRAGDKGYHIGDWPGRTQ